MNRITKIGDKMWRLECEDGSRHVFQKSPSHDKRDDSYWLYLPENSSNRGSVKVDDVMKGRKEYVEFQTVAPREKRILGSSNWKSYLTEEESEIFRRGRNAKKATKSKSASVAEYARSTGFEAVLGFLYLTGKEVRIQELLSQADDRDFAAIDAAKIFKPIR